MTGSVGVGHSDLMSIVAPENYWNETGILVRRCHQINQALFYRELDGFDLTPVQVSVLRIIQRQPGIDQRRLAAAAAVDEATLGGVVRRLIDRSYVEKRSDPTDRRLNRLVIRPDGDEALKAVAPRLQQVQRDLLAPLSQEEAAALKSLLRRLSSAHVDVVNARIGINLRRPKESKAIAPE